MKSKAQVLRELRLVLKFKLKNPPLKDSLNLAYFMGFVDGAATELLWFLKGKNKSK